MQFGLLKCVRELNSGILNAVLKLRNLFVTNNMHIMNIINNMNNLLPIILEADHIIICVSE